MSHHTLPIRLWRSLVRAASFTVLIFTAATASAQDNAPLPSINLTGFEAEMHLTLQADFRRYSVVRPDLAPSLFDLRRARLKVEGTLFSRIGYEIARDVRDDNSPWGDVSANVKIAPELQLRAGRIKLPNGLEYQNSVTEIDFVSRALTSEYLTAGRDLGAMAYGNLADKRVRYQAGIFQAGGDNTRTSEREMSAPSPTLAGRLVVRPWAPLAIGGSITSGGVPGGLNSLRGHDHGDATLFHAVYVNGRRRRVGAELAWQVDRVGIYAERMYVTEERRGMGIDDDDLVPALSKGWYVSGTVLMSGEKPGDRNAVQAAARIEGLRFESAVGNGPVSRDPRARTIAADSGRAITLGINWRAVSSIRLQFNAIRESIERFGAPVTGRTPAWGSVLRLELAL